MKKTLALFLTVVLCLSVLAGCTSSNQSSTGNTASGTSTGNASPSSGSATASPAATEPESTEPAKVSLCMSQMRWGISVDDGHMQKWVEALEEATGIDVEMIAPTNNDYMEKLNVLLASGDYPDVMVPQQAWDYIGQFANRGYLIPLTNYIENDPRFAQVQDTDLTMYQAGDEVYGIPIVKGNVKVFWFRKDMVDKYGMNITDTMTTDAFVTELKKVDQNETIPFCFPKHIINFQIFYNAFGAYGGILKDENGQYYDGIQTQEMKDAFTWIKSLYDEGLMDAEFITNENSNMREKIYTGATASDIDYSGRYQNYVESAAAVEKPTDFIPVYTLVGPKGDFGNLNESGNEAVCVSTTCENVDAAMDLVDYLFFSAEGRLLYTLGVEGVHYDVVDGVLTPREDAVAAGYALNLSDMSAGWAPIDVTALPFRFENVSDDILANNNKYVSSSYDPKYMGPIVKIPMGLSQTYDENVAAYTQNLYEMATKIVLGSQSLEDAYADYEKFWASIQGDKMLQELNAAAN